MQVTLIYVSVAVFSRPTSCTCTSVGKNPIVASRAISTWRTCAVIGIYFAVMTWNKEKAKFSNSSQTTRVPTYFNSTSTTLGNNEIRGEQNSPVLGQYRLEVDTWHRIV